MSDKCLNCDKELIHTEGRRKKKFCGNACRIKYWQNKTKAEPKTRKVPLSEYEEMKEKASLYDNYAIMMPLKAHTNAPKIEYSGKGIISTLDEPPAGHKRVSHIENKDGFTIHHPSQVVKMSNEEIENDIAKIKSETIPKERDTSMGRRSWALDQQKRIKELQQQLK